MCYEESYFNLIGSPKFIVGWSSKNYDILDGLKELKRTIEEHKKQEIEYTQKMEKMGIFEVKRKQQPNGRK